LKTDVFLSIFQIVLIW